MNAKKPQINLLKLDPRWDALTSEWERDAERVLEKIAKTLGKDFKEQAVSIVLTTDQEIQKLNNQFRKKDAPTNVLSFPSDQEGELGDIILAYETIEKEAIEASLPPLNHARHMIVHGFLHLLGYDHMDEESANEMEDLEAKILASLSIPNPYEVL